MAEAKNDHESREPSVSDRLPHMDLELVRGKMARQFLQPLNNFVACCTFSIRTKETAVPQIPVESNSRLSLRIASEEKSLLVRAVLQHTHLTEFVTRTVVAEARKVIEQSERIVLTERDRAHLLNLLEEPPAPNEKLMAAAFALPKR